jgi:SSS family solute:Na+ symporter
VTVGLAILAATLLVALGLGLLARRGRTMSLEEWTVGGRGFGTAFVFLLMAGEIYTTFTFLGGSGWAYGRGAPAFYILCYGALAYVLSYFMLPPMWRYATRHGLHSQADYFVSRYGSRALGLVVSLVSVAAIVPYLVLQLKGLGIIVSETSYGAIAVPHAVWLSTAALVLYVVISGVRGSAWTAVIKDVMILAVAVGLGVWLPRHLYGGLRPMFEAIDRARPGFLALPAHGQSVTWFVSTVLLNALGFYTWPHAFGTVYTARSEDTFRRNAALMPLYQLVLMFVFFAGFAAILAVPGLEGPAADLSLLRVCRLTLPPAVFGLVGAAGLLTALVPGSMLLLTAATILSKNVYGTLAPKAGVARVTWLARAMVPTVALVAVVLSLQGGTTLVPLLLMGYNLVTQLFPAFALSLGARPRVGAIPAMAGILAGVATVACISLSGWPSAVTDLNVGIVALAVNLAVMGVASLVRPRHVT